jgi:hypothetical protein
MGDMTLLQRARAAHLEVAARGDRLVVRGPRSAEPLAKELLARKEEVLTLLAQAPLAPPLGAGDELERVLHLGKRLARGEIAALRCGYNAELCTICHGVPCLGSTPWEKRA